MKPENVQKAVGQIIIGIKNNLRKQEWDVGSEKLNSLAKLVNAYNRLLERSGNGKSGEGSEVKKESYYSKMEREAMSGQR